METNIFSMREVQRNYRKIIDKAKKHGPVFLGAHGKAEAVLLDVDVFQELQTIQKHKKSIKEWERLEIALNRLAAKGRQNTSLSQFLIRDRHAH